MRIIACEDKTDLRTIITKSAFLRKVEKQYKLKSNQAVCFTNKAMTRFRLVFKVSKALFMCVPEIDEQAQYSVYLKISEQLAKLAGIRSRIKFDLFKDNTKKRIKRQQKRKKAAKKATKKAKRPPRRVIIR
jgi:hypothetical protein